MLMEKLWDYAKKAELLEITVPLTESATESMNPNTTTLTTTLIHNVFYLKILCKCRNHILIF